MADRRRDGLPLLGWSTEGGDLRVPHFVGMHALQVIPLAALLLEIGADRIPLLRAAPTRVGLLWILVISYLGALVLLTLQALAGQPVTRPDAGFTAWGLTLIAAAGLAAVVVLTRGHRKVGALRPAAQRRIDLSD